MSDKFEHKAQQLLGNIELEPGEAVWQHVKQEIAPDKRKRRFVFWWILPILLGGAGLVYKMNSRNENNQNKQIAQNHPQLPGPSNNEPKAGNNISYELNRQKTDKPIIRENKEVSIKTAKANTLKKGYSNKRKVQPGQYDPKVSTVTIEATNTTAKQQDQEQLVSVSSTRITTADSAAETKIAEAKKNIQVKDTASTEYSPIVVKRSNHKGWRFGVIAEGGLSTSINTRTTQVLYTNNTITSGPLTGGSFTSSTYEKQQVNMGTLLSIGFTAKKSLSKNMDLHTSLGYVNQSFSVKSTHYKDSLNTHNILSQSTTFYKLHFLDFSVGGNWYFFTKGNSRTGVAISIDNMYLFAANHNVATVNSLSTTGSLLKNTDLSAYNKWQPYLNLGFVAAFTANNKTAVQFSPYFRYALRPFENTQQGGNRLISVGLSTRYFFR